MKMQITLIMRNYSLRILILEKYNELYKWHWSIGAISDKQYVKNLQDCLKDYEEKKVFINEVKAWFN